MLFRRTAVSFIVDLKNCYTGVRSTKKVADGQGRRATLTRASTTNARVASGEQPLYDKQRVLRGAFLQTICSKNARSENTRAARVKQNKNNMTSSAEARRRIRPLLLLFGCTNRRTIFKIDRTWVGAISRIYGCRLKDCTVCDYCYMMMLSRRSIWK